VSSAYPPYKSTDDAFVDWAAEETLDLKEVLFVTTDRELTCRLRDAGAMHIMGTGNWFTCVKTTLGEATYKAILLKK